MRYSHQYLFLSFLFSALLCLNIVFFGYVLKSDISNIPSVLAGSNDVFTITPSAGSGGTITPSTPVSVNSGGSQAFTIAPSSGYKIADVLVNGSSVGAATSHTFTNVTANQTISASFSPSGGGPPSPCGWEEIAAHGTNEISCCTSGQIVCGETGSQICCPSTGKCGGTSNSPTCQTAACGTASKTYPAGSTPFGNDTLCSVGTATTTPAPPTPGHPATWKCFVDTLSAGFVPCSATLASSGSTSHTINASAGSGGSISPSGAVSVADGASQAFNIAANTGYSIANVIVDGVSEGARSYYNFSNVIVDHTIRALFYNAIASYPHSVYLVLNPDYIKETEQSRGFTPAEPITPFDNIVCAMKIPKTDNPQDKYYANLFTTDAQDNRTVVSEDNLVHKTSDAHYDYYEWPIYGFTVPGAGLGIPPGFGIASDFEAYSKLIENKKIACSIKLSDNFFLESAIKEVSLCAHLSGDIEKRPDKSNTSGYQIAFVPGKSVYKYSPNDTPSHSPASIILDGFNLETIIEKTDPFKSYIKNFAFYADLKLYPDDSIDPKNQTQVLVYMNSQSECKDMNVSYLSTALESGGYAVRAIDPSAAGTAAIVMNPREFYTNTVIHELGHCFRLADEYVYRAGMPFDEKSQNCTTEDDCGAFKDSISNYNDGCYPGCSGVGYYRSTMSSLMRYNGHDERVSNNKFNKLSCTLILANIKYKEKAAFLWTECSKMDVVEHQDECTLDNDCIKIPSSQALLAQGCRICKKKNPTDSYTKCWPDPLFISDCLVRFAGIVKEYGKCVNTVDENGVSSCDLTGKWECNSFGGCLSWDYCDVYSHKCKPKNK